MNLKTKRKSVTGANTVTDLDNQFNRGRNQKAFFVSDYAKTTTKKQQICELCVAPLEKRIGAETVCADCLKKSEALATAIFAHVARPRKVIRLQKCVGCGNCKTPAKFSLYYAICKECVAVVRDKSKVAQSNFVERLLNNLRRNIKGVWQNA